MIAQNCAKVVHYDRQNLGSRIIAQLQLPFFFLKYLNNHFGLYFFFLPESLYRLTTSYLNNVRIKCRVIQ